MRLLTISNQVSDGVRALLNNNIIGTPGQSMVYQHQNTDEKLEHISDPRFVTLKLHDQIIGTCCFCKREVLYNHELVPAYYIRYFTFDRRFRSPTRKKVPYKRTNNLLKKEVEELLGGDHLAPSGNYIYYAYIDPDNIRSFSLAQDFHFEPAGLFHTVFFSRLFPSRNRHVSKLKTDEIPFIKDWLKRTYINHHFFSTENIFFNDGYFVYKHKGEITAGIQASAERWKVFELPGENGKVLLKFLSRVPVLNRMFRKNFRFLSVEGIVCKPGHEPHLESLIIDVLARNKVNTAIFCMDPGSREYKLIKSIGQGLMGRITREKKLQVMARSEGLEKGKGGFSYVSAFDVM